MSSSQKNQYVDSNRWEFTDVDPGTDKESYLLDRMGFSPKEVADAVEACGLPSLLAQCVTIRVCFFLVLYVLAQRKLPIQSAKPLAWVLLSIE